MSPDEDSRFHHLGVSRTEGLSETDEEELFVLLGKCRIACSDNIDDDVYEGEDSEENIDLDNEEDREHNADGDNVNKEEVDED